MTAKRTKTAASARKGKARIGSNFEAFLRYQGIEAEVTTAATREIVAMLIERSMQERGLSKSAMARLMKTSRQGVHRLLDPNGGNLTIDTLERAAAAVGKRLRIDLVDAGKDRAA